MILSQIFAPASKKGRGRATGNKGFSKHGLSDDPAFLISKVQPPLYDYSRRSYRMPLCTEKQARAAVP